MKYLLFALVIALPTMAVAEVASRSSQQSYLAQLESLYRCQWLTAASEEEQQQQQQQKKDQAGGDDEPDCD
jgi:hypothetical protein